MSQDFASVGRNIRKYRKARKMSQTDLADAAGLTGNYIGMVERNEKRLSLESFIAVANALHVSSELLLCGVLETGYQVKESLLSEKLGRLRAEDRQEIYDVVESMLKHKKPERL